MQETNASGATPAKSGRFWLYFVLLAAVLGALFYKSFLPGITHFANDGPLGAQMAAQYKLPDCFGGYWIDMNWLGFGSGSAGLTLNSFTFLLLGPLGFSKFLPLVACFALGLGAWFYFRQAGMHPMVCLLGGLAAAVNGNYLSNACWGLGTRAFTLCFVFIALGIIVSKRPPLWLKLPLAGFAIGMGVMEGADNGVLFSFYISAFTVYIMWHQDGKKVLGAVKGVGAVAVMAAFALFIATQVVFSLLGTFKAGSGRTEKGDNQTKEQKYEWATQWSTPKLEALRVVIPGLYGYRMDDASGRAYWGAVGQQAGWEKHHQGLSRFNGSGEYAGVLVVLIALWAVGRSFQGGNAFTPLERRIIWFWSVAALLSLLLAFGRHAPFYRLIFDLPFFSSIRNPMKFMHMVHLAFMILFAYGLQGLSRCYLEGGAPRLLFPVDQVKSWWSRLAGFEKRWTYGMLGVLGLSVVGFLIYASSLKDLERHVAAQEFDSRFAGMIARYSVFEAGLFVVFLAVSVLLLVLAQSGVFSGRRARAGWVLLGIVLVVDLGRAASPWIHHYDYKFKYMTNPVIEMLRDKPHTARVIAPAFQPPPQLAEAQNLLLQVYRIEWTQHLFLYYGIQSLDMIQMPRMMEDYAAFNGAVGSSLARLWQLTNTRYLLAARGFEEALNQQLDPEKRRFKLKSTFEIVPKPHVMQARQLEDLNAETSPNGRCALIEFTGALPRASLYTSWAIQTNDATTLKTLADPAFDPEKSVLVANASLAPSAATNQAGPLPVEYLHYEPKHVELRAKAEAPSVLLLNDKFDPDWNVWVDGQPTTVLRCNYLMRGVHLTPGEHTIVFKFQPKITPTYVSLAAFGVLLLLGVLLRFVLKRQETAAVPTPADGSAPAAGSL